MTMGTVTRWWSVGLAAAGAVLSLLTLAASPADADEVGEAADCGAVDVEVTGDACADTVSVSATGDARGVRCDGAVVACISASGTGDAGNVADTSCASSPFPGWGPAVGCVAVSGTGSASNDAEYFCQPSRQVSIGCVAVSGTGSAGNTAWYCGGGGWLGISCTAISGTGAAANTAGSGEHPGRCGESWGGPYVGLNVELSCWAVSGTGSASNTAASCGPDFRPYGDATLSVTCVAVSGTGPAGNHAGSCSGIGAFAEPRPIVAVGCVALAVQQAVADVGLGGPEPSSAGGLWWWSGPASIR